MLVVFLAAVAMACGGSEDDTTDPTSAPGDPNDPNSPETPTTLGEGDATVPATPGPPASDGGDPTTTDGGPGTKDGGTPSGPLTCVTAATDPAAATTVGNYLTTLGAAGPQGTLRTKVIDAIVRACEMFGPPPSKNPGWARNDCWAHLASEMLKESSYNQTSVVNDSYSKRTVAGQTAKDPTIGLFQIRFSSVVHNYVVQGPLDRLACVGCNLPASLSTHKNEPGDSTFWAVTGPTANLSTVEDVACNVGLGAWYVYLNATGNGKSTTATYLDSYCKGQGTAGNLITGFRSYVEGPSLGKGIIPNQAGVNALQSSDANVYNYVTAIKGSFDGMIPPGAGTHPFFVLLHPNPTQFCR